MHIPELLAPAGGKEAFIAAVTNGADAVYFGGRLFGARQYAANFDREELEWAIDFAHARGVRAYVTVNTLIKDTELEKACDYLRFLCNAGADAVIVQDIGILKLLREHLPELPVHASTQMTIHNAEGAKFLRDMGVKRVVLAREMSFDEIKRVKSESGIEIDTFIHGALCFSYSGQCLLSSMIGGRSGNRGYCAQPCRKRYRAGGVEGYLLSPKDLNMSEHIPELVEAGIDSFKIEGRMKRPEYVAGVVRVYRRLIDRYAEAPSGFHVTEEEKHTLRQLFNRGFTTGYFFGDPGGELISRKYPHNRGTELGKVVGYDPGRKMISIRLTAPLRTGDGIGVGARESGIVVQGMFVDNKKVSYADPGSTVTVPVGTDAAAGDEVFKTYDSMLMASLEKKDVRKIPVIMSFRAHVDEPVELRISDGQTEIRIQGGGASRAKSRPVPKSAIAGQLMKLGTTIFHARDIRFEMDDNIFIPVSMVNSLRREGIERLMNERAQKWKRKCSRPVISPGRMLIKSGRPVLSVNTGSIESFKAAIDGGADEVYFGTGFFENGKQMKAAGVAPAEGIRVHGAGNPLDSGIDENGLINMGHYRHATEYGRKKDVKVYFSTPRIMKNINELNEFYSPQIKMGSQSDASPDGFLVSDPGVLYSLRCLEPALPVILDYPFNIFNRPTMEYLMGQARRMTLSPELTLKEVRYLASFGPAECIVHGNFPLMVSEHDLVGGLFPKGSQEVCLKDEKGFVFPVKTDVKGRTYVMNSRELCMIEYVPEILGAGVDCLRIEAKTYDAAKTGRITRAYREAIDTRIEKKCEGEYTTGHYFRGVL